MTKTFEEKTALEILENSESKVTPLNLIKQLATKTGISPANAKRLIRKLTKDKELEYTYFFGSTYIELSFNKPVKVTDHFVLIPAGIEQTSRQNETNIIIEPGISFGSGRHPTTRLSLTALDQTKLKPSTNKLSGLDIGTGSGVLAIAACKTIISNCLALDIDPNSIAEARKNVLLNRLENQIHVKNTDIFSIDQKFSLIMANLRLPTLNNLAEKITSLSNDESVLIMSGIRTWEKKDLINLYTEHGFCIFWEKDEKNWSCVALQAKNSRIQ